MEEQLDLLGRYLSSNFAVCPCCARLGEPDQSPDREFVHQPSISALFNSCRRCALCLKFLRWLPRAGIQEALEAAQAGLETKLIVRLHKGSDNEFFFKTREHLVSGRLVLCSKVQTMGSFNELCSVRFAACLKGRLAARQLWGCTKKLTFMTRCSLIQNWLQECSANHTHCLAGPSLETKLPVRLIDIGQSLGHISMTLVSVTELASPRYVALSHCWGDPSLMLRTTRVKLAEFGHHINIGDLPLTFRDAVAITQAINIRYLWIDSLCIVQDDPDEWAQEAEKMASIFQNAYLTICAAGARSCKEGCGVSAQFAPAVHVDIASSAKGNSGDSQNVAGIRQLCVRRRDWRRALEHFKAVRGFPICSRGWIFQETLLSRRVIYFTPDGQFYWQCCFFFESEDGILHSDIPDNTTPSSTERLCKPSDRFDKLRNNELAPNIWNDWMCDYFAREFSIKQDRLPALAGAIALYQKVTGDVPVIGMWKRHLPLQLGWRLRCLSTKDSQLIPPRYVQKDESFPSWTFFSVKQHGAVKLRTSRRQAGSEYIFDFECDPLWEASILDIQITWTDRPLVSPLREGRISTRTIIRPCHGTKGATNWQIAFDNGEVRTLVSLDNLYFLLLRVGKFMDQIAFFQLLIQACGTGGDHADLTSRECNTPPHQDLSS